jgi:hypothetical protein
VVRPVKIGSRCQSADAGFDTTCSLVLGLFEKNDWEESIQMEDDVQVRGAWSQVQIVQEALWLKPLCSGVRKEALNGLGKPWSENRSFG